MAEFESRGLVSVFLASSEFAEAASVQSAALGFAAAHVLVPHPIQDRTDDEIRSLADISYDEVRASLTV